MIRFDQVSVTYPDASVPTLRDVNLTVAEGEMCLVIGRSGSGKSTLLSAVNGLVPHFTGGTLAGRVTVAGRDTSTHAPRELADVVGVVGQDPADGFVTDTVEEELAYGMESLGIAPQTMRRRVEEVLDLLGLVELRARALSTLSAGQQQRVALASVLTVHPQVLVLDEPTSALDPPAAEEVLAALHRLVHDLGITLLLAEHRLERVVQHADRIVYVPGKARPLEIGTPAEVLTTAPVAPPVVELGRLVGWDPLPLTIRDARRHATALRNRLADDFKAGRSDPAAPTPGDVIARTQRLTVRFGGVTALREVDLTLRQGEIIALMGRNGSGKSTLLRTLAGMVAPTGGTVQTFGEDPRSVRPLVRRIGLVPQRPADLLYAETVAAECAAADADADAAPGTCRRLTDQLLPDISPDTHPRDLSEGQRLGLALAIVLTGEPPIVLLDEPTRGLDYGAKQRLVTILRELAIAGHGIILATHDVELAATAATRTMMLADGEVVVDGPTDQVVVGSPAFAPQVAKVLAPEPWLTVEQVAHALGARP